MTRHRAHLHSGVCGTLAGRLPMGAAPAPARVRTGRAVLAAAVLLAGAGCGAARAAHAAGPVSTADNVQVCRNYQKQRAWEKSLVQPSLGDAVQWAGDIAADSANATPRTALARDLTAMSDAEQATFAHPGRPVSSYAASARVIADCQALGIRF